MYACCLLIPFEHSWNFQPSQINSFAKCASCVILARECKWKFLLGFLVQTINWGFFGCWIVTFILSRPQTLPGIEQIDPIMLYNVCQGLFILSTPFCTRKLTCKVFVAPYEAFNLSQDQWHWPDSSSFKSQLEWYGTYVVVTWDVR